MGQKKKPSSRRRSRSTRKRRGRAFKAISIDEACKIGGFSRRHFYRIEDKQLEVHRDGRMVWVNEQSVVDYIRRLPR